jgi:hypothetical protein
MRALTLALVLTVPLPASAETTCSKAGEAYGAIMRASLHCNLPIQRVVRRSMDLVREACSSTQEARPAVEAGFRIFDAELSRYGKAEACNRWGRFVRALSQ